MSTITPADAIEAIWDAVQSAADGYHNTQQWGEEGHFAPDVSYWKQIRAAVDLAKSLAPTPAAPEPPVPVDLDFEAVRCEIYHKDPKAMAELDKIEKAFAALRSRLSEVEGAQDAINAIQEEKDHWQAQADRMADPGKSTAGAYYLGIVKGLEKARGFLPAEGTAKPSQDPKPSLTDAGGLPSDYGAKEAHRIAKHWLKAGDEAEPYKQALTWRNGLSAVESFLLMTTGQFPQPQHPGEAK